MRNLRWFGALEEDGTKRGQQLNLKYIKLYTRVSDGQYLQ